MSGVVRHSILMIVLVCRPPCVVGVLLVSLLMVPWYSKLQPPLVYPCLSLPPLWFLLTVCPCVWFWYSTYVVFVYASPTYAYFFTTFIKLLYLNCHFTTHARARSSTHGGGLGHSQPTPVVPREWRLFRQNPLAIELIFVASWFGSTNQQQTCEVLLAVGFTCDDFSLAVALQWLTAIFRTIPEDLGWSHCGPLADRTLIPPRCRRSPATLCSKRVEFITTVVGGYSGKNDAPRTCGDVVLFSAPCRARCLR